MRACDGGGGRVAKGSWWGIRFMIRERFPGKKKSNSLGWLKVPGGNSAQISDFDNLFGG